MSRLTHAVNTASKNTQTNKQTNKQNMNKLSKQYVCKVTVKITYYTTIVYKRTITGFIADDKVVYQGVR